MRGAQGLAGGAPGGTAAGILVFTALGWERRAVLEGVGRARWVRREGRAWEATVARREGARSVPVRVVVVESGAGLAAAGRAAWASPAARWFVVAGSAGGLDATLAAGDLVIADRIVTRAAAGGGRVYPCPEAAAPLVALARGGGLRAVAGPVLSSPVPLLTAAAKAEAARAAVAVEMEGAAIAAVAAARGARLVCVRAVLDGAMDELPEAGRLVDEAGSVRPFAALSLLARPGLWPRLYRLGCQARRARAALAAFFRLFLSPAGLAAIEGASSLPA